MVFNVFLWFHCFVFIKDSFSNEEGSSIIIVQQTEGTFHTYPRYPS